MSNIEKLSDINRLSQVLGDCIKYIFEGVSHPMLALNYCFKVNLLSSVWQGHNQWYLYSGWRQFWCVSFARLPCRCNFSLFFFSYYCFGFRDFFQNNLPIKSQQIIAGMWETCAETCGGNHWHCAVVRLHLAWLASRKVR